MPTLVGGLDDLWSIGRDGALTCGLRSLLDIRIITPMCCAMISFHEVVFSVEFGLTVQDG